jgi:hypothetical protein
MAVQEQKAPIPWTATSPRSARCGVKARPKLEKKDLHRLTPGVVQIEGPGVVFRFLSYDLEKIERNRYNLDKGTVTRPMRLRES